MTDRDAGGRDFDDEWARIVARLTDADAADEPDDQGPGPADPVAGTGQAGTGEAGTGQARPGDADSLARLFEPLRRTPPPAQAGPTPPEATPPDAFVDNWADEGHFTPPPPPELPEGTPVTRLAWVGTLGGPATLLLIAVTGWDAPRIVVIAAGLSFLAGFATLVWGMPESREDGWDDGARL